MTKPKVSGQCPICLKVLQHVSKHIREFHGIKNARERTILNAICTGRVVIGKGTCPVPGCGLFRRRLAIHIERHSDLLPGRRAAYLQVARRDAALKQLSELRDTDPQPPMASSLDLEDSLASECRHPSCIQREFRIRELEDVLEMRSAGRSNEEQEDVGEMGSAGRSNEEQEDVGEMGSAGRSNEEQEDVGEMGSAGRSNEEQEEGEGSRQI
ncbi:unnamed protein product [Knipowitschia caucasica]|uniref:C2H2-type domain-containing protein n=1 Tax=Knipowitschia caucasica TaxID=637954 RepID=A0AAV2LNT3_KNICA